MLPPSAWNAVEKLIVCIALHRKRISELRINICSSWHLGSLLGPGTWTRPTLTPATHAATRFTYRRRTEPAASWVKQVGAAGGNAILWQTAANFRQRRYGYWKRQFCFQIFPKMGFSAQILHFWTKIFRLENFPTAKNLRGQLPLSLLLQRRHWMESRADNENFYDV